MQIRVDSFWTAKGGNSELEYEDAVWPRASLTQRVRTFRAAVADGATETSFSGLWARILVRAYGKGAFDRNDPLEVLAPLQRRWRRRLENLKLPWYAEEKLAKGAFAALVGITIAETPDRCRHRWQSLAVGDSCLFQFRDNQLLTSVPYKEPEQFLSRPHLISTHSGENVALVNHITSAYGTCCRGDVFYLMSDAIACWFLGCTQHRTTDFLERLNGITNTDEFAALVGDARRGEIMKDVYLKNDDTTLLRCTIE